MMYELVLRCFPLCALAVLMCSVGGERAAPWVGKGGKERQAGTRD